MTPPSSHPNSLLVAENICLARNGRPLLKPLSCRFPAKAFSAILGPNGSGKSTLVRILSGEWTSDQGKVLWEGRNIHHLQGPELATFRACLPQESHPAFPFLTREILEIGSRNLPFDLNEVAQLFSIEHLLQRNFSTLSGGEKQRVQLARIHAQLYHRLSEKKPCLILLDEPTNNLDLKGQRDILSLCQRWSGQWGATVIAVLHNIGQTIRFADHCLLMKEGQLENSGSPREIITPEAIEKLFQLPTDEASFLIPIAFAERSKLDD